MNGHKRSGFIGRWNPLTRADLSPHPGEDRIDILSEVRLQSVGAAVMASFAVLLVLLLYALIPSDSPIERVPYFIIFGAATLCSLGVAMLPWRAFVERGLVLPALYVWSAIDVGLVSAGVALSGGSRSELYLVYLVLCIFQAGVAYPRRARTALTVLVIGAYLLTLAGTGWKIGTAVLVLRLGMIFATAAAADILSIRLTGELLFHEQATSEFEQRASMWSRVAGLGNQLGDLDEPAILAWAVDAVGQLGLEASAICMFVDGGERYRVVHPRGLPPGFADADVMPAGRGMSAMIRRKRGTVVVDQYQLLPDVIPEIQDQGFRTVVATPMWVEGEMAAMLVGGSRNERPVAAEEVAAFELLAAHAGTGITAARKLEDQRRDAAHFRSLVESAPDAMIVMDTEGFIVEANHQVRMVFGYDPAELIGKPVELLMPEQSRHFARAYRERFVHNPRSVVVGELEEVRGLHRDGTEFPIEIVIGPIDTPEGLVVTATVRDVTERREFERRLAHQASHDDLTGLPNRTLFLDRLTDSLDQASPAGPSVAVCFLDVDHFKYVNDSRGHTVGDELVVEVARRISLTARSADVVARFGGDEFAVLVEGLADRQGAVAYAWRLLAAFDRPFVLQGVECYVSASVGIAFGAKGDDPHHLLRNADAAMYHAKQRGRARVELFDETLTTRAVERVDIESSLHHALLAGEFSLLYQPYIDLHDGSVMGVEALLRWQHPERGMVPPLAFIPIAEESGLILQIGRWALLQACRQAAEWTRRAPEGSRFSVSVNVSNRQLEHDHMIADVAAVLEETGVPPESLILEITESFFIRDLHAAVRRLHALRRLGVRIAIDDFGTGFSSLNSLSRLPIDVVKIDKSFIDGLGTRYDSVIGAVVEVAAAFDLSVVAEGVERVEQADRLREIGCRYAQGYLFSRPVPAQQVEHLLATAH
ncbi:MAG TPA: EAL domain-containing protein [Acidimicrobiales bacterium]|nr:EAL domain-containing protein [Acidimicrobiales bacterium]